MLRLPGSGWGHNNQPEAHIVMFGHSESCWGSLDSIGIPQGRLGALMVDLCFQGQVRAPRVYLGVAGLN